MQNNIESEHRTSNDTKDEPCKIVDSIMNKWYSNGKIFQKIHKTSTATINNAKANQHETLGDKEEDEIEEIILLVHNKIKKQSFEAEDTNLRAYHVNAITIKALEDKITKSYR